MDDEVKTEEAMSEGDLSAIVQDMISSCEQRNTSDMQDNRTRALEYYEGRMTDTPSDPNRSSVTSRDVRGAIRKIMPSLMRTFLASDRVVKYEPQNESDEETAQQATDYINYLFLKRCSGYTVMWNAIHDALLLRNGIIKHYWEYKKSIEYSTHTGLSMMQLQELLNDETVKLMEIDTKQATDEEILQYDPNAVVFDAKICKTDDAGQLCIECIPPEDFLIDPNATCITDAIVCGQKRVVTRSDMIAMGFDKDIVDGLSAYSDTTSIEKTTRREGVDVLSYDSGIGGKATERVLLYELYAKIDFDGDGIAELRKIFATSEGDILTNEEFDDFPFSDVTAEIVPHRWQGRSVFDDVEDIQRVKTVLKRQTLDNIYWQNNPQPVVQEGVIVNPESVLSPSFGEPIRVNEGVDVRTALSFNAVPFVAAEAFNMLQYLDRELTDRTGINDASSGMSPDILQNISATASNMIDNGSTASTELMARNMAELGFKRMFSCILKLVIQHQNRPDVIRLRDSWVEFDPKMWNANMDASVNVGLGSGSREKDMMALNAVSMRQEKIIATMGMENPFVTSKNISAVNERFVEASGLRNPDIYFNDPEDEEIEQYKQTQAAKPNPEVEKEKAKAEVSMQIEQMRQQFQGQMKQAELEYQYQLEAQKSQAAQDKEMAQMQADLTVQENQRQADFEAKQHELTIKAMDNEAKLAMEKYKVDTQAQIAREQIQKDYDLAQMNIQAQAAKNIYDAENTKAENAEKAKQEVDD